MQHCRELKTLQFAGPNENVTISDMLTIGHLHKLEVLNVDQQTAFGDETLKLMGTECLNLRALSCAACYGVSDTGISCLSSCHQLSDVTISYCHLVSDQGLAKLVHPGMRRLCMRACQSITDSVISQLALTCLQLEELDVSGCFSVSNQSLCTLQESILHMRSPQHPFTLLAGGSCIESEAVLKFASATGATVNLHDLSNPSLSADYDPYLHMAPLDLNPPEGEVEDWDTGEGEGGGGSDRDTLPSMQPESCLETSDLSPDHHSDYLMERAEDYLVADDPALFSDEFSEPEEWGMS